MCNKLGRLSRGCKKHEGNDTIEFIFQKEKPKDIRSTYVREFCDIIPQKTETHITILNARENCIYYPGKFSTPISDLTTMKIHVNSAISDIKSSYMYMFIKYFLLKNQMDRAEYIMIQISIIPQ